MKFYISNFKILPHEEVERGRGLGSKAADVAAAVTQQSEAQIGTQFRFLIEQKAGKLLNEQFKENYMKCHYNWQIYLN